MFNFARSGNGAHRIIHGQYVFDIALWEPSRIVDREEAEYSSQWPSNFLDWDSTE